MPSGLKKKKIAFWCKELKVGRWPGLLRRPPPWALEGSVLNSVLLFDSLHLHSFGPQCFQR